MPQNALQNEPLLAHNVLGQNAVARRPIINSPWPRGGGNGAAELFIDERRFAPCYALRAPGVRKLACKVCRLDDSDGT